MKQTTAVIVRDFDVDALIGIYPHERTTAQKIRVDVTIQLGAYAVEQDQISSTISYEDIVMEIRRQAQTHHNLVETLAAILAKFSMTDPRALSASVQVRKLDVFDEGSVGCVVTLER